MNFKFLTPLVMFFSFVSQVEARVSFEYTYQVTGNSYSFEDQQLTYEYKERLIDTYEELVFDQPQREHQDIIIKNIDLFSFDNNCVATYKNGGILLIIGDGNGFIYKGNLRKNSCDNSVYREKYYIYEIFN